MVVMVVVLFRLGSSFALDDDNFAHLPSRRHWDEAGIHWENIPMRPVRNSGGERGNFPERPSGKRPSPGGAESVHAFRGLAGAHRRGARIAIGSCDISL